MLVKIYELINRLEGEIGNGAVVELSIREDMLYIRVDWRDDDFHAMTKFGHGELVQIMDDSLPLNYFVEYCKNEYSRKKNKKPTPPPS